MVATVFDMMIESTFTLLGWIQLLFLCGNIQYLVSVNVLFLS